MNAELASKVQSEVAEIRAAGLYKEERQIQSAQGARIRVGGREVLNFCANNYLGLANDPRLLRAASESLEKSGLGLASVRFICGTQDHHKALEQRIAAFLGMEETILYSSCFDANGGLFETLLGEEDAIISDSLNHASIIDGIRLCKAERLRYTHNRLDELEAHLKSTQARRTRLIATDGVFSMDGDIAPLADICALADRYRAAVMVDDSHATGFIGKTGRGTPEYCGVSGRIDVMTSTLGKALGGASGGFTSGSRGIIELLRQRSRPYLFSNTLPPALVAASLRCLELLTESTALRDRLEKNTEWFREHIAGAGFQIRPGTHPIVPIMLGDARIATGMAGRLLDEGIYVIGFSFPVVPKGQARIRVQISAAHEPAHLQQAVSAFRKVGQEFGIVA